MLKIQVFWDMMQCSQQLITDVLEVLAAYSLNRQTADFLDIS
jgi:hypothetical protein